MNFDAIHGAILGSVVADAIGLPYEALSRRRGVRLLGPPDRHRFVFGRGMMSDDGEHTCMVARALVECAGDVGRFRRSLVRQLRWWLLGMPAGIGGATLRAAVKLWLGFPPTRSGVFSAGNGPAMRAAVLGVGVANASDVSAFVRASTTITHTDPKAFHGALAVALAARCASEGKSGHDLIGLLRRELGDEAGELVSLVENAVASAGRGETTPRFAESIGCGRGVSGYVLHTVPVAIHAWTSHPADYRRAVTSAVECGGDTDTVAACVGGIVGSRVGAAGIPEDWRNGLLEWPRTLSWIERLARAAASANAGDVVSKTPTVGPLVLLRNIVFTVVVILHVVRRALPPY